MLTKGKQKTLARDQSWIEHKPASLNFRMSPFVSDFLVVVCVNAAQFLVVIFSSTNLTKNREASIKTIISGCKRLYPDQKICKHMNHTSTETIVLRS